MFAFENVVETSCNVLDKQVISARREGIRDEAVAAAGLASHPRTEGAEEAEASGPSARRRSRGPSRSRVLSSDELRLGR